MYKQNYYHLIGAGFSQTKANTKTHKMTSKVCALFSPKYSKKKLIHYVQQNCCFIKKITTYSVLHKIFTYNIDLDRLRARSRSLKGQNTYFIGL